MRRLIKVFELVRVIRPERRAETAVFFELVEGHQTRKIKRTIRFPSIRKGFSEPLRRENIRGVRRYVSRHREFSFIITVTNGPDIWW